MKAIRVERLLQCSLAVMVVLGTWVLCLEDKSPTLRVVAVIVAVSSVILTDITGWLKLNRLVGNVAGLVISVVVLNGFFKLAPDEKLLTMTRLVAYLQFIVLYQEKTLERYWLLATLSLVQVAVGTVLLIDLSFGLLLFIYLAVGLITLILFLLHREQCRFTDGEPVSPPEGNVTAIRPASRWPLAGRSAVLTRAASVDASAGVLSWAFARQSAAVVLAIFVLTSVIFASVPRVRRGSFTAQPGLERRIGFTEEIKLGSGGPVREDETDVMQIRFVDPQTGDVYPLSDEPLFRGSVLSRYHDGTWEKRPGRASVMTGEYPSDYTGLVRQEIRRDPGATDIVFCIHPVLNVERKVSLNYDPSLGQVTCRTDPDAAQVTLMTTGIRAGRFPAITPADAPMRTGLLTQLPVDQALIEKLRDLADSVTAGAPSDDRVARAEAIETHLRDSGEFSYDLASPGRPRFDDPVEDFLFNTKKGHCEYFASALALLLRSQGIPSRIVQGFRNGEWNSLGEFYRVQQLHAHSWVEVYLEPDQIPEQARLDFPSERWRLGGWLRLDATPPGGASGALAGDGARLRTFGELVAYIDYLWFVYVLQMDSQSQLQAIYRPLVNGLKRLVSPDAWREVFQSLPALLRGEADLSGGLLWNLGLLAILGILAGMLVSRMVRRGVRRWRRVRGTQAVAADGRPAPVVEFFQRFEELLAGRGFHRPPTQTPLEFAEELGGRLLTDEADSAGTNGSLRDVVRAFYLVRFGGRTLSDTERDSVERALEAIQKAFDAPRTPSLA